MFLLWTSNSSFREDEAGWLSLSMKIPAIKWRGMTFHIECEVCFRELFRKKSEVEISSSVRNVFNTSQNKMLYQFILKMLLSIEKLDGLVDTPLSVAPSKQCLFKSAFASANEYSLSNCFPCLLQPAAETCNSVQKFLNFISVTSTLPFTVCTSSTSVTSLFTWRISELLVL